MLLRMADRLADMEVVFGSESILSKESLALAQASQAIQSHGFTDAWPVGGGRVAADGGKVARLELFHDALHERCPEI
jgi:hypothetical protein